MKINNTNSVDYSNYKNNNVNSSVTFGYCPCMDKKKTVKVIKKPQETKKAANSFMTTVKQVFVAIKNKLFGVDKLAKYNPKNYAAKKYTDLNKGLRTEVNTKTIRSLKKQSDGTHLFIEKDHQTGELLKQEKVIINDKTGKVCEVVGYDTKDTSKLKYLIDYQGNDYPMTITEYNPITEKRVLTIQTYPKTGKPHKVKEWDVIKNKFVSTEYNPDGKVVK